MCGGRTTDPLNSCGTSGIAPGPVVPEVVWCRLKSMHPRPWPRPQQGRPSVETVPATTQRHHLEPQYRGRGGRTQLNSRFAQAVKNSKAGQPGRRGDFAVDHDSLKIHALASVPLQTEHVLARVGMSASCVVLARTPFGFRYPTSPLLPPSSAGHDHAGSSGQWIRSQHSLGSPPRRRPQQCPGHQCLGWSPTATADKRLRSGPGPEPILARSRFPENRKHPGSHPRPPRRSP